MLRCLIFFAVLLGCTVAQAQIYTWIDEQGRTHYSDSQPDDQTVQELAIDSHNVSTIGASGLRPGEVALLEQIREDERRSSELRAQRELARIAAARQQALLEEAGNAADNASETLYDQPYYYPLSYGYSGYRRHSKRVRSGTTLRLRAQLGDNQLKINPKPKRQWRDKPHAHRNKAEFRHGTPRKPVAGVRHRIAE